MKKEQTMMREKLAKYAHGTWIGWVNYIFGKSIEYKPGRIQAEEGALIIPKWAVDRWTFQMNTAYDELPEEMKESDRKEADRIIAIVTNSVNFKKGE